MKRTLRFRKQRADSPRESLSQPNTASIDQPPELEFIPATKLKPYPRNARMHSAKQVRQIAESMRRFGVTAPVLIDENNTVLAGHGRLLAAKQLKLKSLPCRRLAGLSEAEKRAYVLADNKLVLNGTWDDEILAGELKGLLTENFDISVTGFSLPEVDTLIEGLAPEEPGAPEDDVLPPDVPKRCRSGDIWQMGRSRLICGDALEGAVVAALMNGEKAQMAFTDPPYNVPIDGHVGGRGAIKHREFAMASGEMTPAQFEQFLRVAFSRMAEVSIDGSIHFVTMDWRHVVEVVSAGKAVFTALKNLIVWVKDNGGMGSFYRSRHELIFPFLHGSAPHINNFARWRSLSGRTSS